MKPGDLIVSQSKLGLFRHDSEFRSIVNRGVIDATGAAGLIVRWQNDDIDQYCYELMPVGSCLMYVAKSDINFVHTSQPLTPVHFLFYNGLSCVMIASDSLIERSFRVISHS